MPGPGISPALDDPGASNDTNFNGNSQSRSDSHGKRNNNSQRAPSRSGRPHKDPRIDDESMGGTSQVSVEGSRLDEFFQASYDERLGDSPIPTAPISKARLETLQEQAKRSLDASQIAISNLAHQIGLQNYVEASKVYTMFCEDVNATFATGKALCLTHTRSTTILQTYEEQDARYNELLKAIKGQTDVTNKILFTQQSFSKRLEVLERNTRKDWSDMMDEEDSNNKKVKSPAKRTYSSIASKAAPQAPVKSAKKTARAAPKGLSKEQKTVVVQLVDRVDSLDPIRKNARALDEMMESVNKALRDAGFPNIQICELSITLSGNVSMETKGKETDAQLLRDKRDIWTPCIYLLKGNINTMDARQVWYKLIVHGVPLDIYNHDHGMEHFRRTLKEYNDIEVITPPYWLKSESERSYSDNGQTKLSSSVVIAVSSPQEQNDIAGRRIRQNRNRLRVTKWQEYSSTTQCRNCCGYGHGEKTCLHPTRCMKCAGEHSTSSCNSSTRKCLHCAGNHSANDRSCPAFSDAQQRQKLWSARQRDGLEDTDTTIHADDPQSQSTPARTSQPCVTLSPTTPDTHMTQ